MALTMDILTALKDTPLNALLLLPIIYLAWDIVFPKPATPARGAPIPSSYEKAYAWKPKSHPPVILFKKYSPKTLEPFSGQNGTKILLAINKVVYDVTAGRSFYGPGALILLLSDGRIAERLCIACRWTVRELCRSGRVAGNGQAVIRLG